jgi:hypothetical protein
MTFTLCKARIFYSALLLLNHAIEYLLEKALGSGGKSEDQPFSVKMPLHHAHCPGILQIPGQKSLFF